MKNKIISLALCLTLLASIFVCGNVLAKTEVTVPARTIFSQSFAGLSELPSGWTITGTKDTNYTFSSDAIRAVASKNATLTYANGFDTDGHSYTFNFRLSCYNWSPYVIVGGYKITLHMASDSKYCDYWVDKLNSSGSYTRIATGYSNGGSNYAYQSLQSYKLIVDTENGKVGLYLGNTLLCEAEDNAPSTSGSVKFYLTSQSNTKSGVASASLTVDEYSYFEYEDGEIEVIDVDIKLGDYVQIGTYNDEAILWRCVDIDENGPLMLADKIISLKAFDAKGESTFGSHARDIDDARAEFGSNYWNDANLRLWLNSNASEGTVIYSCGNKPTDANVWSGYNEYDTEAGFLSNDNFTALERNAMKVVSQKNILNSVDSALATAGSTTHIYNADVNDAMQNYADAYSVTSSDKVFLLDIPQVQAVKANLGDYYMAKPSDAAINASEFRDIQTLTSSKNYRYWLRTPYASADEEAYPEYLRYVDTDGTIGYGKYPAYTPMGVRPAFYLDTENAQFGAGTGKAGDPYTIAVDINATGDYYDAGFTYARSPMVHLNQSFANLSAAPEGWTVGGKNGSNINFTETNGYATTINETGKNFSTSYMNYTKNIDMGDNYVVSSKRYKCGYNNYIYMYAGAASAAQTGSKAPSTGYALLFQGNVLKLYKDGAVKATSATLSLDSTSIFAIEVTGNTVKGVAYNIGGTEQASINFTDDSPITSGYCGYIFNSVRYPQIYDFTVKTVYPTVNECTNPFIFSKTFTENDSVAGLKEAGYVLNAEAQSRSSFTSAGMKVTSSSSSIRYAGNQFFGNYSFEWKNTFSYNSAGAYVNCADASNYYKIDYGSISQLNTVKVTKYVDGTAYVLYNNNSGLSGFNSNASINKINVKSNYDGSLTLDISLKGGAFKLSLTDMPGDADGDPILRGGVGVFTTNTPATIPYIKVYTTPTNASNTPAYSLKYQVNNATVSQAAKGKTSLYMPVVEVGKEGTVIAAAFDGDKLIKVKVLDIYDFYGSPKIKVFDTTDEKTLNIKLKVFTWDGIDTLVPLELPYEI